MRGIGYGVDGLRGANIPQGLRSGFRDGSGHVLSVPRDAAEIAPACVMENNLEIAYRRCDLFATADQDDGRWGTIHKFRDGRSKDDWENAQESIDLTVWVTRSLSPESAVWPCRFSMDKPRPRPSLTACRRGYCNTGTDGGSEKESRLKSPPPMERRFPG